MSTAYLFTDECVGSGAIVPQFQRVALSAGSTAVLDFGLGHAIRCAPTPVIESFTKEKSRLEREVWPTDEVGKELERLALTRLRIAAKGHTRTENARPGQNPLQPVHEDIQLQDGVYMMGQAAALRDCCCTVRQLHEQVCRGAAERLRAWRPAPACTAPTRPAYPPLDIAIVGMACLLPGATNVEDFWHNILVKRDLVTEVPAYRFDASRWYDPDRGARDKVYSKWGGFLGDTAFDPLKYGIPPAALKSIEPAQLLALELVEQALRDAGYLEANPYRERTGVIFGVSGGLGDLGQKYVVRALLPQLLGQAGAPLYDQLPEWTEDSFPGILPNIIAARVTNRFDLGGENYTVDAACASSLAAVFHACRGLTDGSSDMVIAGGCDLIQGPFAYLCFAKSGALSPTGKPRVFDAGADGITISEGLAAVVLKRRANAERDGDCIYALIRGVAGGSDGRSMGITAPRLEGQLRTLRRAYQATGFGASTLGLFEAHGTGTALGDVTELKSLSALLTEDGAARHQCAVGSVKSMIGHTKSTAGIAGLIKAALALHRHVLPPTLNVDRPNPEAGLADGPLYVNSELRPWIRGPHPRRAGVSAFGFGGTNFHAVLEEYEDQPVSGRHQGAHRRWPAELFAFDAESAAELSHRVGRFEIAVREAVGAGAKIELADLAFTLHRQNQATRMRCRSAAAFACRAAVVASGVGELIEQLAGLVAALRSPSTAAQNAVGGLPKGVYFSPAPLGAAPAVAFLFPGQGAQFPGMLCDLAVEFPEVADCFAEADAVLAGHHDRRLSEYVFPAPAFTDEERAAAVKRLESSEVAQPAMGVCGLALCRLLAALGVRPAMAAGHSYGELVALCVAGSFDEAELYRLSWARGEAIRGAASADPRQPVPAETDLGGMVAVRAELQRVEACLAGCADVWIANRNSPQQVVLSGTKLGIAKIQEVLRAAGIESVPLQVAAGFHSPLIAPAKERFEHTLQTMAFQTARLPVFSNVSGERYPADAPQIRALLARQLVSGVNFVQEIEEMYAAGARLFVELGPTRLLSKFVDQILQDRPHQAVALQARGVSGVVQLLHALAALIVQGGNVDIERLYQGRRLRELDQAKEIALARRPQPSHLWLVNGAEARPASGSRAAAVAEMPAAQSIEPQPTVRTGAAVPEPVPSAHEEPTVMIATQREPVDIPPSPAAVDAYGQFQETMRQFLTAQQRVFEAFLQSGGGSVARTYAPQPALPAQEKPLPPPAVEAPRATPPAAVEAPRAIPPVAAEPPAPETSPPARPVDLTDLLMQTTSDRTGYPIEMLTLDARLEADLGIDSIKFVEIVATFRKAAMPSLKEPPAAMMQRLANAKTLRAILEAVSEFRDHEQPASPGPVAASADPPAPAAGLKRVARYVGKAIEIPADNDDRAGTPQGVLILTDDGRGAAAAVARSAEAQGRSVAVLGADALSSAMATAEAVQQVRRVHGPIAGVLHLLPLSDAPRFPGDGEKVWVEWMDRELKSVLYLLQAIAPELDAAAERLVCVAAVSIGGGDFLARGELEAVHPWRGGLAGMLKTAAIEWPSARFRVLDVDEIPDPARLLAEWTAAGPVEIGLRRGRRLSVQAVPTELPESEPSRPAVELTRDSVVLLTGGAQGITAEAAKEIAERSQATLILLGRSPLPVPAEDAATFGIEDLVELRRAVMRQMLAGNGQTPAREIEAEVQRLCKAREIRRTLAAIRRAGSQVEYFSCDVRDESALEAVIGQVRRRYGGIDVLVHGAGVIEDCLIGEKSAASFDRVVQTKVVPMFVFARLLDPKRLKLAMLFSSTSGFFGNPGQVDYAAANEILNRIACRLANLWLGKVVAINWGPWAGAGMVRPEVAEQLAQRGIPTISIAAGRRAIWQEIVHHGGEGVRVVIGSGPWAAAVEAASAPVTTTCGNSRLCSTEGVLAR